MNKIDFHHQRTEMPSVQALEQWYSDYTAWGGGNISKVESVSKGLQTIELDTEAIENDVRERMSNVFVSQGFCTECQDLFDHWPDLKETWECTVRRRCHTNGLEAAARKGCKFCKYLIQVLTDVSYLDIFRKIEVIIKRLGKDDACSLTIQKWAFGSRILWLNYPGQVSRDNNSPGAAMQRFFSHALEIDESRHGQSEDIFDTAQVWLKDCIDNHKFCQHKEGDEGPTRLLFIADGKVRLVETAGRYKGQYSTLSHAWGTKPFLKLTHATYQQFLQQIPFGQLQKTFQDAISISRRLNIDFIWIDSLCIIQEDEADWTRESGRMSVVYGRSTLNIAATSAVDGSQGCFLKAPSVIGGVQTRVTVDGKPELRNFHRGQFEYDMATTSHLATRAWTVQEKVLAPRTMYIGDRGVVWECRTTIASEFLPDGFQDPLIISIVSRGEDRLREHWSTIMELYSRASLTYASDKLPALSGMARQVADESHDDYIAGMWREGLDFQLCWRTVGRTTRTAYRAPSWCWTSLDGPIKLPGGHFKEELVQVLDTNVKLCGEDPFGHVQGGWIKLACSTMGIGYAIDRPEPLRYWNPNSYEIKLMVGMDEWEEAPFIVERDYTDEQPGVGDKVYLVPLRAGSVGYGVGEWFSIAFCGILLQEYGSKKGEFMRVGSFQFHGEQKHKSKEDAVGSSTMPITRGDYTRFKEILNQAGAEIAERASTGITKHMGDIGTGYVITIV